MLKQLVLQKDHSVKAEDYLECGPLSIKALCALFLQFHPHMLDGLVIRSCEIPRNMLTTSSLFSSGFMLIGFVFVPQHDVYKDHYKDQMVVNEGIYFTKCTDNEPPMVMWSGLATWVENQCYISRVMSKGYPDHLTFYHDYLDFDRHLIASNRIILPPLSYERLELSKAWSPNEFLLI